MSRVIRFRAWDKDLKKMNPVGSLEYTGGETIVRTYFPAPWGGGMIMGNDQMVGDKVELMQFTGLTDKNGKEIYEGDIVKGKNLEGFEELAEVKWDYVQWSPLAGHRAFDECEVIGNIYENPELVVK